MTPKDRIRALWRVGTKVQLNVYEGDRPVCQCHNAEDAKRIVEAMQPMNQNSVARELEEWSDSLEGIEKFCIPPTWTEVRTMFRRRAKKLRNDQDDTQG